MLLYNNLRFSTLSKDKRKILNFMTGFVWKHSMFRKKNGFVSAFFFCKFNFLNLTRDTKVNCRRRRGMMNEEIVNKI